MEHFLKSLNGKNGRRRTFAGETIERLMQYSYPGNVRELKNLIERVFMLSDNDVIGLEDLPGEVTESTEGDDLLSSDHWRGLTLGPIIKRTEMKVIAETLKEVKGNKLQGSTVVEHLPVNACTQRLRNTSSADMLVPADDLPVHLLQLSRLSVITVNHLQGVCLPLR